jgi:hypothetical protein
MFHVAAGGYGGALSSNHPRFGPGFRVSIIRNESKSHIHGGSQ